MSDLAAFPIDQSIPVIIPDITIGGGPRQSTSPLILSYSGRLFAVVCNVNIDTIYVYTSLDGQTWTQCDSGNRPNDGLAVLWHAYAEGQYIRIAYVFDDRPDFDLRIKTFDMAAQLWVAGELTGGPDEATNSGRFEMKQTISIGTNEYFTFYSKYSTAPGTAQDLRFSYYQAGAWVTHQVLDAERPILPKCLQARRLCQRRHIHPLPFTTSETPFPPSISRSITSASDSPIGPLAAEPRLRRTAECSPIR